MRVINVSLTELETKVLMIGFQGENEITQVRIDAAEILTDYPNATPTLIAKPLFGFAYPVIVAQDGTDVVWEIDNSVLSFHGDGEIQLTFTEGTVIAKSYVGRIRIKRSLEVNGEKPDPIETWEQAATAKLAEVDAQISELEGMVDAAEAAKDQAQDIVDDAAADIQAAGATQIAAVEAKGEEVKDSIPSDYTALTGEVSGLKSAINDLEDEIEGMPIQHQEELNIQLLNGKLLIARSSNSLYGQTYDASTWRYTDFISCEKYKSIDITMPKVANATDAGIVFYSDNDETNIPANCVAGYPCNYGASESSVREVRRFDIPTGAKYFRTAYRASLSDFSCIGYWESRSGGLSGLIQDVGDLSDLETEEKGSIVEAVNGVNANTDEALSVLFDGIVVEKSEHAVVPVVSGGIIIANPSDSYYGKKYDVSGSSAYSGFVNIEKYNSIDISMLKYVSPTNAGIVFYSDNNAENIPSNVVAAYTCNSGAESTTVETRHFEIPEGAKYFRTTFRTTDTCEYTGYYEETGESVVTAITELQENIDDIQEDVANLKTEVEDGTVEYTEEIPVEFVQTSAIIIANPNDSYYGKAYGTGTVPTNEITDFISIEKYNSIDISMLKYVSPTNAGIVFYSDNNAENIPSNVVAAYTCNSGAESTTVETRHFEIPEGAKYFRTTFITTMEFTCNGSYSLETGGIAGVYAETMENAKKIAELESDIYDKTVAIRVADFDDGEMTDDQIISAALAFASNGSNRVIVFDTKDWHISQAILLDSNTTVYIDGVKIKQNDLTFDNVFRGSNFVVDPENPNLFALSCGETENIRIIGLNGATIEGPDVNATIFNPYLQETVTMVGDEYGWRAFQLYFCNCDGFEISGLRITKTRNWAISFEFCKNGYIHDIYFNSRGVKNGDGIDFRIGCNHIKVDNITGFTKDDTVACTALYPGYSNASYPSQTSDSMFPGVASRSGENLENVDQRLLDVHDIMITNVFTGGNEHGIICLCNNGLRVYNIVINNVNEEQQSTRESVVKVYTGYGSSWHSGSYTAGDLHNISAGAITANGATYAFQCNCAVTDVYLNKLVQSVTGKSIYSISDMSGITITNTEQ